MNQDLLDATVYSFIQQFAFDAADKAAVPPIQTYKGYQNFNAPPKQDYVVFTMISSEPKERKMVGFNSDGTNGQVIAANMRWNTYQIMSVGTKGRSRLQRMLQAFESYLGASWMQNYTAFDNYGGAAPIRTGTVIDMSEEGSAGKWEVVHVCDFIIAARMELSMDQDWAEQIDPKIILAGVDRIIR